MYEITNSVERSYCEKQNERTSKNKVVRHHLVRMASFLLVYFLLDNNYSLFNAVFGIILISLGFIDLISE